MGERRLTDLETAGSPWAPSHDPPDRREIVAVDHRVVEPPAPRTAGGGGSFNAGTEPVNLAGVGTGEGLVTITYLGP